MIHQRITPARIDWFRVRAYAAMGLFLAVFWGGVVSVVWGAL